MTVFDQAVAFATKAHGDQKRKYTLDPYIVHPIAVAGRVRDYLSQMGTTSVTLEAVCAAAVMHDVLEDTAVTKDEMHGLFGILITTLVSEVTDVSTLADGNREARKALDRQHISLASYYGKMIKLCDLMDNTSSIVKHDPKFAKVYLAEKELLLQAMKNDSRFAPPVWPLDDAWDTLKWAKRSLLWHGEYK